MIQLLVIANNRPHYLKRVMASLDRYLPQFPRIICDDIDHVGMAANIQRGWTAALGHDWDYLFHWEDDMELLFTPPIDLMVEVLEDHPEVANLMLKRQPWNDFEHQCGDVLEAIKQLAPNYIDYGLWAAHDHIFSLNPCLIPRRIVEAGWPAGNEAEKTTQLRDKGFLFGCWGTTKSKPYLNHIGDERGPGWKL